MSTDLVHKLGKYISKARKLPSSAMQPRDKVRFSRKLPDVRWQPDYLFKDTRTRRYIAFTEVPSAESFPIILAEEVKKAMGGCDFDFFFILQDEQLLDIFEESCREKGFGLILVKKNRLLLIRDAVNPVIPLVSPAQYVGHYPSWVINKIPTFTLGNSKFRTLLKDFSKEYLKLKSKSKLDQQREEELVKDTIAKLLKSDDNYTSGIDSFEILSRFESSLDIRDHYFHSFHIFLLGLFILDRYQSDFKTYFKSIFPKYRGLSLEFMWLLTSVFHDVGYLIAKLDDLKREFYGVSTISSEREITNVWDDPVYKENLKQLISLFKFSVSEKKHKIDWPPDVFGTQDESLEQIFRESFHDSHGVASCFRFLVDIFSEARQEEKPEKRMFLVYHIYPAGLSIALHDKQFRERLSKKHLKKLSLSRFPFAVLLIYLDSLQEDKREKSLCLETPELLQGFQYNGKILATVNESIAKSYPRLGKLKAECRDFINSVKCDGIRFEYPMILLT